MTAIKEKQPAESEKQKKRKKTPFGKPQKRRIQRAANKIGLKATGQRANKLEMSKRVAFVASCISRGYTNGEIKDALFELGATGKDGNPLCDRSIEKLKDDARALLKDHMPPKEAVAMAVLREAWDSYFTAREKGDLKNAIAALGLIMKIFGIHDVEINAVVNTNTTITMKGLESSWKEYTAALVEAGDSDKNMKKND